MWGLCRRDGPREAVRPAPTTIKGMGIDWCAVVISRKIPSHTSIWSPRFSGSAVMIVMPPADGIVGVHHAPPHSYHGLDRAAAPPASHECRVATMSQFCIIEHDHVVRRRF